VKLPKGGRATWEGTYSYWDRNGDGKPDRIRLYWGSGYSREYFDDNFDGDWDGAEHARGYKLATGLKENRIPEGLTDADNNQIVGSLKYCLPAN
jgi:hypothetical protein